jgi:ChrR Cupin-like domain
MDAVTPKGSETVDAHSHLVRPATMEWQKTRFPGCEAKTLLFDRATGVMTALMRFAPGAVLPDHEHVNIEQTYVLEGHLVDKEGPAKGIEARQPPRRMVSRGRADARDVSGPQQVLRGGWARRRCRGAGLERDLGAYRQDRFLRRAARPRCHFSCRRLRWRPDGSPPPAARGPRRPKRRAEARSHARVRGSDAHRQRPA